MQESFGSSQIKENHHQLDSTFINQAYSRTVHQQQQHDQSKPSSSLQALDQIQKQMKQVQAKLINILEQKQTRNLSNEEYYQLQDERVKLKKYLIDLDNRHKQCCYKIRKDAEDQSRRKWEDIYKKMEEQEKQIERQRQEERLERDRLLEQKLKDIEQSSRKRREQIEELYNRSLSNNNQQNNSRLNQQNQKISEQEIEKNILYRNKKAGQGKTQSDLLEQQRYNAKIAAIERQLASESLRRSRQIELEGQLVRLNTLSAHYREPYYPLYYSHLSYMPYDPLYPGIYSTYPYI